MGEMHDMIEKLSSWYDDVKVLETERLIMLLGLGARVTKLLETADRVASLGKSRDRSRNDKVGN